jgi:S1-C subfamily serine protease
MKVKKSGRTTGLTHGIIEQVDVTVRVNFGAGKTALFRDQLLAGAMSQGGDSGSAVLNEKNELVGLLFAGSSNTTIFNRIQNVMELLDVEIL